MPNPLFQELAFHPTELGDLSLRRRTLLSLDNLEIYEILLGDAYLMSSLFTEVEQALATLGLAAARENVAKPDETPLDVVVGGLGLGYTARTALEQADTGSLCVVDYLSPVIEWHEQGLVPLGSDLTADPRCRFVHGDFFELALAPPSSGLGFDPDDPDKRFHAILLDIDHSPDKLLHERHREFYSPDGLRTLSAKLHPGGVFALWSDDPPETGFLDALEEVFATTESHVVKFFNPLQERDSASTVYVATKER